MFKGRILSTVTHRRYRRITLDEPLRTELPAPSLRREERRSRGRGTVATVETLLAKRIREGEVGSRLNSAVTRVKERPGFPSFREQAI